MEKPKMNDLRWKQPVECGGTWWEPRRAMASLAILTALTPSVLAQEGTTPGTAPPATGNTAGAEEGRVPGLITSPTYVISVEDSLEISITALDGLGQKISQTAQTVLDDGTLDLPYLGETKVVGMKLADLKKKLGKAVSKYIAKPQVVVAVRGRYTRQINVFGGILPKTGKMALRENWRVKDVIAAAGGISNDRYELYQAFLYRNRTGEKIRLDLEKLLVNNDPSQNLLVEAEDTLDIAPISETLTRIHVTGEVEKPGPYLYPRNGSILDILQLAQPTPAARLSQTTIERDGKSILIDLSGYRKAGFEPKERLEFGDRVNIPRNRQEYYLFGRFGNGGTRIYPDDRKITLMDVIAETGGKVEGGELKATQITRVQPDGTTRTFKVNVEKMLKSGNYSEDVVVEPGDRIYLPPSKRPGISVQQVLQIMGSALFAWQFIQVIRR